MMKNELNLKRTFFFYSNDTPYHHYRFVTSKVTLHFNHILTTIMLIIRLKMLNIIMLHIDNAWCMNNYIEKINPHF